MVMHIEPGKYDLKQFYGGAVVEVGKLVVVAGPPVVEHWYLYTAAPGPTGTEARRYGLYTVPSRAINSSPAPGSSPTATSVTTSFDHMDDEPAGFDGTKYAPQPGSAGFRWRYISCSITPRGSFTASPLRPRRQGPSTDGQIDWGVFHILQSGEHVGYVEVHRTTSGTLTPDLPIETWTMFTSIPDSHSHYQPPGASGGAYTLQFTRESTTPTGSIEPGTHYAVVDGACSAPALP